MMIPVNLLKAVALAAGRHDVRFYLNSVLVDGAHLVATDGWRMHVGTLDTLAAFAMPVIVPLDAVANAVRGVTARDMLIALEFDGTAWSLGGIPFTPIDARYPQWQRIRPTGTIDAAPPTLRAPHVADVAKAATWLEGKRARVVTGVVPGGQQVVFTVLGRDDFTAVVMGDR